jgi:adenylate kinase
MVLIFLGPPGVGKGTQATLLAERFGIPHVSTGEILRSAVSSGSALGKKAADFLQRGDLVPDDIMVNVVGEELIKPKYSSGFILDGFPRTIAQAMALDELFRRLDISIDAVLSLEAEEKELIRRLSRRRMCRNCGAIFNLDLDEVSDPAVCPLCGGELYQRDDDKEETIKNRFKVHRLVTEPLRDYYSRRGLLIPIDGVGEIHSIFEGIVARLSKQNAKAGGS